MSRSSNSSSASFADCEIVDHGPKHGSIMRMNRLLALEGQAAQSATEALPFDLDRLRRMAGQAARITTFPYEIRDRGMEPSLRLGSVVGVDAEQRGLISGELYLLQFPAIGTQPRAAIVRRVYNGERPGVLLVRAEDETYSEPPMPAEKVLAAIRGRVVWVMQPIDERINLRNYW
jgi:hypothetical protein